MIKWMYAGIDITYNANSCQAGTIMKLYASVVAFHQIVDPPASYFLGIK